MDVIINHHILLLLVNSEMKILYTIQVNLRNDIVIVILATTTKRRTYIAFGPSFIVMYKLRSD